MEAIRQMLIEMGIEARQRWLLTRDPWALNVEDWAWGLVGLLNEINSPTERGNPDREASGVIEDKMS
jgi:hypothetical protein